MLANSPLYSYIPAKDVARARRFYEQKLGFRPKAELAGGVVYEFGQKTACFLYPTPNAGTSKASQAFWQVAAGGAKAAWFKDTEGNILAIVQNV
jgi:catechol 2,3-dioxygenase-like lactoylglutathione lyase family enzyme